MTDMTPEQVVRRYQAGDSLREIAKATGLNHETIRQRLVAAGVELRKAHFHHGRRRSQSRINAERDKAICQERDQGMRRVALARKYGVSVSRINQIIREGAGR